MGDRAAKCALYDRFAEVGRALGSGKRLELLDLLAQGERTVESVATAAALRLTTASAHLQTLRRAGLVTTRRDGTRVHYSLAGDDVASLFVRLRAVAQERVAGTEPARRAYLGLADHDDVDEIRHDELLARAAAGDVVVLDVRPAHEFGHSHIPGAVSIPIEELADRLGELPTGRTIVAYCRGGYCVFAYDAVRLLRRRGVAAARLADGMLEWRLAGLPVSTGDAA